MAGAKDIGDASGEIDGLPSSRLLLADLCRAASREEGVAGLDVWWE